MRSYGVRGTLRCKRLGSYGLVLATGEGSHNREGRFTIFYLALKKISSLVSSGS